MVAMVERQNQGRGARGAGPGEGVSARAGASYRRDAARDGAQINISRRPGNAAPDRVPPVLRPRHPTTPPCPLLAYLIHAVSGMQAFSC